MRTTMMTGQTRVDLRLSPLDVGFDLRAAGIAVELPAIEAAGYEVSDAAR